MSVLFTFPGQGAQKPGMLHALPAHPATARTLDEASTALGRSVLELDGANALQSTVAVQLCLLVAGVAMARVLAEHDARPAMVAGLSIGAYPAAVTAGVLAFSDALELVALRARLMEQGRPSGYGMLAVMGLTRQQLEPLIAQVHRPGMEAYLANVNGARQLVVSGADAALAAVGALALDAGAQRSERLAVPVPSHCELFAHEAQEMADAFAKVEVQRPRIVFISSSQGRAMFDARAIATDLAVNLARPVLCSDTLRHAYERGARLAVEMPSGAVLTRLAEPVFVDGRVLACDGNRLDTIIDSIREA
ncbi:MAG: malonate decarboxylase subunit epsilon [Gammaproteobacteria bacterium]